MRTYLNLEKGHIQALLRALEELEVFRGFLTERQTFVETLLTEALDRIDKEYKYECNGTRRKNSST